MRRAERNAALNGLGNVRFVNAAAGDRPGEMRLYRPGARDANRARASLLHHAYLTGVPVTVPVMTLDDICRGQRVALVKIDVEGHEAAVVRGAAATIAAHMPSIIFEYAPELLGGGLRSPFEWLAGQGYEMFNVRARRNRITGRICLALDRMPDQPAHAGNLLAVSPAAIKKTGSLTRLRVL
jgi:FkbM family methyltransferase